MEQAVIFMLSKEYRVNFPFNDGRYGSIWNWQLIMNHRVPSKISAHPRKVFWKLERLALCFKFLIIFLYVQLKLKKLCLILHQFFLYLIMIQCISDSFIKLKLFQIRFEKFFQKKTAKLVFLTSTRGNQILNC